MSRHPLHDLYRESEPPDALKERVMQSLEARGLVSTTFPLLWRRFRVAAVAAAALFAGILLGRTIRPGVVDAPRFVLLLYEDSSYRDDRPVAEIVADYARWADSLREEGSLQLGDKLADRAVVLGPPDAADPSGAPTGLFIVRARDLEQARRIAASSPHLRQGGRIALHPIDETPR